MIVPPRLGRGVLSPAPEPFPLAISASNARYFAKHDGTVVYLAGSHHWGNFHDRGTTDPPPVFDFNGYLAELVSRGHNCFRLWCGWEQTKWTSSAKTPSTLQWHYPGPPWQRTGPGNANDGKLKFDLTLLNQAFFDRLRARVIAARDRGIYVAIMLFDGFALANDFNSSTGGFPWQSGNNVNGFAVSDVNYDTLLDSAVTTIQDALIEKYVDTVNDLQNVIWEVCNEPATSSNTLAWEAHVISKLKAYEATKSYQHPVGMTSTGYPGFNDADLFASDAAWISWTDRYGASSGSKVVLNDTDHSYGYVSLLSDGATVFRPWPFQCLCQGTQPLFMDPWVEQWTGRNAPGGTITGGQGQTLDTQWDPIRNAMGDARTYANRVNLKLCVPHSALSTTGYCLANPGSQYIAVQPGSGAFDVTMVAGTYQYEWFDIVNRSVNGTGSVTVGTGVHTFTPPFSGAALLLLTQ